MHFWSFWAKYCHFCTFCPMPDQKPMWTRCLGGFSVMWVTKLLIPPVKNGFFAPKRPNLARNWHFCPLLYLCFIVFVCEKAWLLSNTWASQDHRLSLPSWSQLPCRTRLFNPFTLKSSAMIFNTANYTNQKKTCNLWNSSLRNYLYAILLYVYRTQYTQYPNAK